MPKPNKYVWEKAPKGCTHYNNVCPNPYLKLHKGVYYYWSWDEWFEYPEQRYGAEHIMHGIKNPNHKYKTNKDGWIRHRGGVTKNVPVGSVVEIRQRNGVFDTFTQLQCCINKDSVSWKHFGAESPMGCSDIMAYKLKEQPKQ